MIKRTWQIGPLALFDRILIAFAVLRGRIAIESQDRKGRCVSVLCRIENGRVIIELDTLTTDEQYEQLTGEKPERK